MFFALFATATVFLLSRHSALCLYLGNVIMARSREKWLERPALVIMGLIRCFVEKSPPKLGE